MTIFAVEAGGFDDYGVRALFTSREMAQRYADAFPENHEASVNPWELDLIAPQVTQGYKRYTINMASDGTLIEIHQMSPDVERDELQKHDKCLGYRLANLPEGWSKVERKAQSYASNICTGPGLIGGVWARNEEHALALAEEKRREFYDI